MFQGLAVKQAPNTGSPDRTGAGSPLRCAPPPSGMLREGYPTGTMCYATARAQARPSTSSGQALPEMRDNRGESPTRPCPPYPLRPYGVQAGAFGGAFGGPPSPFSSKMERESPPLPLSPSVSLLAKRIFI